MAIFKINGVDMPSPSDMQPGIQDLSKAERNANGLAIVERIATKDKLSFTWSYVSQADLSLILNAVQNVFFQVTFIHPRTGQLKTGTFYCSDRNVGVMDVQNGVVRYKDLKFDVVER
ncbi:DUF6711 family protein [Paenibacillus sp. MMO-58]|uniref:DUF6711 family protein n=1 Tax=Paenibacillus sp. MMO-58 TaxID=3081290 RepID=UPI00301A14EF